ncbi:MAG: hypothetical protein WBP22_04195 [Candidatus Saccharimonas sp.]
MSELHRDVSQERSDQERVTPLLVVDERLSEIARCEFDMAALGDLMRTYNMTDERISATSVRVEDIEPELGKHYRSSQFFEGQIPGGKYLRSTKEILAYSFEHFRERRNDPDHQMHDMDLAEAISRLEEWLNGAILHEAGHAIYHYRCDRLIEKADNALLGSLGVAAVGLTSLVAGYLLGPNGTGKIHEMSSRRLSRGGRKAIVSGLASAAAILSPIFVEIANDAIKDKHVSYGRWYYDMVDRDERFARKFEKRHADMQIVKITPLENEQD